MPITEYYNLPDIYISEGDEYMTNQKKLLGDLLLEVGLLKEENLRAALEIQKKTGKKLGDILVQEKFVSQDDIIQVLEFQLGIPHVKLEKYNIEPSAYLQIPEHLARRHASIPISSKNGILTVAMADPLNIIAIDDIKLFSGMEIQPVISIYSDIMSAIDRCYTTQQAMNAVEEFKKGQVVQKAAQNSKEVKDLNSFTDPDGENINNSPVVKLANSIIEQGVREKVSDIHIEPYEDYIRVRYRKDGHLYEAMRAEIGILPGLSTRIKIISGLNITEKRIPQDGRITLQIDGREVDLRVAVSPTIFGEQIVIRIADQNAFILPKEKLGFSEDDKIKFSKMLLNPHGIILVTGPTGSGKTTTLYSALNEINKPSIKIITIEDPVESTIEGVNHIQANVKAGLTFAVGLRSILRLDPDVVMIGEIRDSETAEISVRAAITGHLVLSTLHTNDAPSTIIRLIDMGIQPFLVASSVVGVISQRLIKQICPNCSTSYPASKDNLEILGMDTNDNVNLFKGRGCAMCGGSGYRGRLGVYEIMVLTSVHKEAISKNCTEGELRRISVDHGMKTLKENAKKFVLEGKTTIEEMIRISYSND